MRRRRVLSSREHSSRAGEARSFKIGLRHTVDQYAHPIDCGLALSHHGVSAIRSSFDLTAGVEEPAAFSFKPVTLHCSGATAFGIVDNGSQ